MSPGKVGTVLAQKAAEKGVEFVQDEIRRLSRDEDGWKISCGTHTFHADTVVVALGVWSAGLLEPLGLKLPLMAERGYHVEFPKPQVELNNSIMDMDAKTVSSSMEGGLRMAGQAEFAPIDAPLDPRRQKRLETAARTAFPDLNIEDSRFWMGRRPSFPDSLPAIGHVDGLPGLHVNFGHSHHGLMMAPQSGEILAELIMDGRINLDLAALSPERFET
jgi:D-amino-acid dehydrogenase